MNGVAARLQRQRDQALAVEIGGDARSPERMRLVRLAHVQRGRVVVGIDGDAGDAEIGGRARDADGDFAAIGDEQLAEGYAWHRDPVIRFSSENSAPGSRAPSNRPAAGSGRDIGEMDLPCLPALRTNAARYRRAAGSLVAAGASAPPRGAL